MKLVYLEWQDAQTWERWKEISEAIRWAEEGDWIVKQVGWLIKETKDYILLAGSYAPEDEWQHERIADFIKIPKGWIRKHKVINI